MNTAFLGLGRMGRELAAHLLNSGHELTVWNRSPASADALADAGAVVASSAADAVRSQDVVVTMLFGPQQVKQVVCDAELPFEPGSLWIDATTVAPADAEANAAWAHARKIRFAHAPVTGSVPAAAAGQLGALLGGDDLDQVAEIVGAWADPQRVRRFGSTGQAAGAKLVANVGVVLAFQAVVEGLKVGRSAGLEPEQVLEVLQAGPVAPIVAAKASTITERSFSSTQFSVDLVAKDIVLMRSATQLPLPATTAVLAELTAAQRAGLGDEDFSVIVAPEL
jgi:3-hydroxyisobutyrate dehydrogenase